MADSSPEATASSRRPGSSADATSPGSQASHATTSASRASVPPSEPRSASRASFSQFDMPADRLGASPDDRRAHSRARPRRDPALLVESGLAPNRFRPPRVSTQACLQRARRQPRPPPRPTTSSLRWGRRGACSCQDPGSKKTTRTNAITSRRSRRPSRGPSRTVRAVCLRRQVEARFSTSST